MEYQFIRDPISGFRVKISDEQALIGRWFNEELAHNEVKDLLAQCRNIKSFNTPLVRLGKEVRFKLCEQEALFEAHSLFNNNDDLAQYQDDALELDEHGLMAVCGFEDFVELLEAWHDFIGRGR